MLLFMFSVITECGREWEFFCRFRAEAFAAQNPNCIRSWK